MNHWKNYAPVEGITVFDANSTGPTVTALQVIANTHTSDSYPEARIGVAIGGLGSVALTVEQSTSLRAHLERAERDVKAGGPPATTAVGAEGRCESCSQPVRAGELIYAYEDVTVHAGSCPGVQPTKPERS